MYQLLKNSCYASKVAKARQIIFRYMSYKLQTSPKNKRSQQNIDAVAWFWWLGIWVKLMFSWSEEECTNKRRCSAVQVHYSCWKTNIEDCVVIFCFLITCWRTLVYDAASCDNIWMKTIRGYVLVIYSRTWARYINYTQRLQKSIGPPHPVSWHAISEGVKHGNEDVAVQLDSLGHGARDDGRGGTGEWQLKDITSWWRLYEN